jgi:hypothetical protein
MKACIATSGTIFGLVTLAHVARVVIERWSLAKEPAYIAFTLAAAAMAVWAFRSYPRAASKP